MARQTVYLETTIVSYLTAWPSRDLVMAAHQQITHEWWDNDRREFDLRISQPVLDEAGAGDLEAAARRLQILSTLPRLEVTREAITLAQVLLDQTPMPPRASVDALHVAVAAVHGIDHLLTWNCKHIANTVIRPGVEAVCRACGYRPPIICTPEEIIGGQSNVGR